MSKLREIWRQSFGPPAADLVKGETGDVLVFSMRGVSDLPAYCVQYEFEDLIVALTGADRIGPTRTEAIEFQRKIYKAFYLATGSSAFSLRMTPQLGGLRVDKDYGLFIAVFNDPYELFALRSAPGWRARCRQAVCVITEAWETDLPEYLLKSLADFDRIYLTANPVESVGRITGRPCTYLPLGVDTLSLCPYPNPPPRSIDVLGVGRRSNTTHGALMDLARNEGRFYYYDTVKSNSVADAARQVTFSVIDPAEHRFKLASLLKRSRYYLASRARANEAEAAAVDEVSGRFFEGAASGAIMIGDPPKTGPYLSLFDWPDVVIESPFDDPDIGAVMTRLEADPERCSRIRKTNIVNALRRHDGAYRLRRILEETGMPVPQALAARESRLAQLARDVESDPALI